MLTRHIAGQDTLLDLHFLAVLRLDHLLGRDDDAPEAGPLPHRLDPVLEVGLHLVLVTRVGVDDVPAEHRLASAALLHELLPDLVVEQR